MTDKTTQTTPDHDNALPLEIIPYGSVTSRHWYTLTLTDDYSKWIPDNRNTN